MNAQDRMQEAHDNFGHHNVRRCKEMAKVLGVLGLCQ